MGMTQGLYRDIIQIIEDKMEKNVRTSDGNRGYIVICRN